MKRVLPLLSGLLFLASLGLAPLVAQERVAVTFKVFPPDYELFWGGDRLPHSPKGEGLRTYLLPAGSLRVNLTASGSSPLALSLEVKPGMATVQAKLEPRQGPLSLVGEAATGKAPRNVTFTADGRHLLVSLIGEPGVEVYQVPSLKRLERLETASTSPSGFTDVLAVGKSLWAIQKDGRIHLFDGTTLAFQESLVLPRSGNATLSDLGGRVAVANWDDSVITVVDANTRKVLSTMTLGGSLRGLTFLQGVGYASLFDKGQVAVIDTSTMKVRSLWSVGKAPRPMAAAGAKLFVGDMGAAQVLVLDLNGKVTKTIPVPSNPHQMAVSADQSLVAVASRGRNNPADYLLPGPDFGRVTLMTAQGTIEATVWGRNQPTGLAFSPDGRYLAFTDFLDNNLELYRITR